MFVQFYAPAMDIMVAVYAIVKKVIKVANVKYQQENVKYPDVMHTVVVLKVNAIVNVVLKDTIALNVSKLNLSFTYKFFSIFFFSQSHLNEKRNRIPNNQI